MNRLNKYHDYINEGFFSKDFNDYIKRVDDLYISFHYNFSFKNWDKLDYIRTEIIYILNRILLKYNRKLTQEEMDIFMKRFNEFLSTSIGHRTLNYQRNSIKDYVNSIIGILRHLRSFYGFDIKIIGNKNFDYDNDEGVEFYKKNDYFFLIPLKNIKIYKEKEHKDHLNVDPLGEENWSE